MALQGALASVGDYRRSLVHGGRPSSQCQSPSLRALRRSTVTPRPLRLTPLAPNRQRRSSGWRKSEGKVVAAFWFFGRGASSNAAATEAATEEAVAREENAAQRKNASAGRGGQQPKIQQQTERAVKNPISTPVKAPGGGGENWQRLTNVSFYPSAAKSFQPSRWHVKRKVGQGSYGVVYLAEDHHNDLTRRAVKVLSKTRERVDTEKVMWKLQNEIQLLGCVQSCPTAVRFHEVLEDKERIYLVMDSLEGGTLQDLMDSRSGPFPEAEAALAMADVLRFLATCHQHQICYADTKPSNFMFQEEYKGLRSLSPGSKGLGLRAIDMGCSKVVRDGTKLTKRMGTPAYFAPEVFLRSYDTRADLWSAGILSYQLLTGRFPYWASLKSLTTSDVMDSVIHKKVRYESQYWSHLSPEAKDFTASLLHRQAGLRMSAKDALKHPWITRNLKKVGA